MSEQDRHRWNEKYSRNEHSSPEPSRIIMEAACYLPNKKGRALDVAGGTGRHSLWLAKRGWEVTLADLSDEALRVARERASSASLRLNVQQIDLEHDPFPQGPWDLIVCVHYLWRPLFLDICKHLSRGGRLFFLQPTRINLERNDKPSVRFLLEEGELPELASDLVVVHYAEGWLEEGRHEAFLVAERLPSGT